MKKWQKITGCLVSAIIHTAGIADMGKCIPGFEVQNRALCLEYDLEHIVDTAYLWIGGLSISMWLNLALAVVLFICL